MVKESGDISILDFHHVAPRVAPRRYAPLELVDLRLVGGELALVRFAPGSRPLPLAAAAQGLVELESGELKFLGRPWGRMSPVGEAKRRGRIGRVFDGWGWVSNLNVAENVTLAQRHHTTRPTAEIEKEADALARSFGLPRVPRGRPSFVPTLALCRAQWVRAFLGSPELVLLERPMRGAPADCLVSLIAAVDSVRRRGGAVLWCTSDEAVWKHEFSDSVHRFVIQADRLQPFSGKQA